MERIRDFIVNAVVYPCSGTDGNPVQLLHKLFQRFIYIDKSVSREEFLATANGLGKDPRGKRRRGFRGYTPANVNEFRFHDGSGDSLAVTEVSFIRADGFGEDHGPTTFMMWHVHGEAIAALKMLLAVAGSGPACLCHVRPGLGFGDNHPDYCKHIGELFEASPNYLPRFLLWQRDVCPGVQLAFINRYSEAQSWKMREEYTQFRTRTNLSLSRLDDRAPSAVSHAHPPVAA